MHLAVELQKPLTVIVTADSAQFQTVLEAVRVPRLGRGRPRTRPDKGRGTWIPDMLSLGTRSHPRGKDFAAVRAHRPAVCVELRRPSPYARLAVTDPDPEAAAHAVRTAAGI
ncbi:hypothetical protein ACIRQP_31740 [Streptomyces sp. NPDC102274]|uniref:hypothetical protein n=1 Tax=Streptomyces sp. NPDC102274 TaxID=3366151 RepID=UPI003822E2EC